MQAALYIHIPWCVRKCPYCDFNSHQQNGHLPETDYINALIEDFKADLSQFNLKIISSIFIGGGTPSLLSAQAYARLFENLTRYVSFADNIEITLEANPGTVDSERFKGYRDLGINRLSLGIQSFNLKHLKHLGRIHDDKAAHRAIETARWAGFDNINLDIMHSLPNQSIKEGLNDLQTALSYTPEHLSWYQLTVEPNTAFYKKPPVLLDEDQSFLLEQQGLDYLKSQGYNRYEISAFSRDKPCKHNLNYWRFGDYYGIGAGAHGKLTLENKLYRTQKYRQPKDYLNPNKSFISQVQTLTSKDIIFEYMLNLSRLEEPIAYDLFVKTTGCDQSLLKPLLKEAYDKGFIHLDDRIWQVTALGRRYTNDLQTLFL